MRLLMTFISCFMLTLANAQELQTKPLLPPDSKDLSDLSFLKGELQNKQMVMLGELTHAYTTIFEAKIRVFQYLHQELGFNTFAIESPMYDIYKMNQQGFDADVFNNAIWGVWSQDDAFQELVQYIETNNIKVIGFDSQIQNSANFIEDFFDFCEQHKIAIKLDQDDLGIVLEGLLENAKYDNSDIKATAFLKEMNRIIKQIELLPDSDTTYHWQQFTKGVLAVAEDVITTKEPILTSDFATKDLNIRDKQMADNLLSYSKRNPTEKIAVWGDNIHVMYSNPNSGNVYAREFVSMGKHIQDALQDKVYSLATLHANDSIFDSSTKIWHEAPIAANSFEEELVQLGTPNLFISSNQEAMHQPKSTRLLHYVDFSTERLDLFHDGYLFIHKVSSPYIDFNKRKSAAKKPEITTTEQATVTSEKFIGQLIDKYTNQPIAYATIILKDLELYRVTDENGYYELPFVPSAQANATFEVQAMGYNPLLVSLHKLQKTELVEPNYEELAEIVIKKQLSAKEIVKAAIANKGKNHPDSPYNFMRYSRTIENVNDKNTLDLELITKDYDQGYLSSFITTQRLEQINWNNKKDKNLKYVSQLLQFRENPIRYANILHKRKYKKFKLNFIESKDANEDNLYIIAFETDRDKWNYTNRTYPTKYSGVLYIDKESFAIIKVIENWEITLNEVEIAKRFKGYPRFADVIQFVSKEENITSFAKVLDDNKYYANSYFNRAFNEYTNKENKKGSNVYLTDSYAYDFTNENIDVIPYEHRVKDLTRFDRATYDKVFWDNFFQEHPDFVLKNKYTKE
ncbi:MULTISPECIES: erythromycin esterase family protein [unclassified Myroides]|uniref:erythromycin esterase family protein n=1 Tax=unclassified Myroides TaxID=2642485 RepID=UPI0031017D53